MSLKKIRNYNASIILDTRGYEEPVETLIEKLKGILTELGAEVTGTENIGRMDFIRVTNPKHTGDSYLEISFSGEPTLPASFHEKVRLDRTVKRLVIQAA
jgi:small subunit ribosomal protein S6